MDEDISRLMDGELDDDEVERACGAAEASATAMADLGVLPRDRRHAARRPHRVAPGFSRALRGRARGRADGARAAAPQPARPASCGLGRRGDGRRGRRRRLDRVRRRIDPQPTAIAKAREAAAVRAGAGRAADVPADYLLAHQEYSPTTQIQGVGRYLRAVVATAGSATPRP